MMQEVFVSVIIPVYNAEAYLAECLESVQAQTMPEIEIICIDDGSTDRSPDILDEYSQKDSRITVVHQANAGPSAARNRGIGMAKGKYIQFVDSDDAIAPALCEKTYQASEREQADMMFFLYQAMGRPSKRSDTTLESLVQNHTRLNLDAMIFGEIQVLLRSSNPWAKLWNSSFLRKNNIRFPEEITLSEDVVAFCDALTCRPKIGIVAEELYIYRDNPSSLTRNTSLGRENDTVTACRMIKDLLIDKGNYAGEMKSYYLYMKLHSLFYRYGFIDKRYRKEMRKLIHDAVDEDDRLFLRSSNNLGILANFFYAALNGSLFAKARYATVSVLSRAKNSLLKK